jgi:hypothetical protein
VRVLVCGSRDWTERAPVEAVLNGIYWEASGREEEVTIIEGGAKGADACAAAWVTGDDEMPEGLFHEQYPAEWDKHGNAAGPIRNRQMLDTKPDLVVAFSEHPITRGTNDMIRRAKAAGIPVWVISHG